MTYRLLSCLPELSSVKGPTLVPAEQGGQGRAVHICAQGAVCQQDLLLCPGAEHHPSKEHFNGMEH